MNSYKFEKAAKNGVIIILSEKHGIKGINIDDMQIVWFSHTLGAKKCTLYSPKMGKKYAEVTYNKEKDEMYVDIYEKISNTVIGKEDFNTDASTYLANL